MLELSVKSTVLHIWWQGKVIIKMGQEIVSIWYYKNQLAVFITNQKNSHTIIRLIYIMLLLDLRNILRKSIKSVIKGMIS